MKVRVITGLTAAALPIFCLFILQSPMLGIVLALFSVMACLEICHAARVTNKPMLAVSAIVAGMTPLVLEYGVFSRREIPGFIPILFYFFLLIALMLAQFEKTRLTHVMFAMVGSLAVPSALACLTLLRDFITVREGAAFEDNLAVEVVFFTMCSAWFMDTFAYFVGVKLGKHKLCPKISPKKTVEGAVGGILCTVLLNLGFAAMFNAFFLHHYRFNLLTIGLLTVPLCIVAMLGDLTASTLKRNYDTKDFGKFFPGHGGVMDRCDSLLFVAPLMLALVQLEHMLGLQVLYMVV